MSISCPVRNRARIVKNVKIERQLSGPGKILVKKGAKIVPSDIMGEAKISPKLIVFDLPKLLKVRPAKASDLLLFPIGERVVQDQPIARSQSLFLGKRTLIAPQNGVLFEFERASGSLTFQPEAEGKEKLLALVWGKVDEVEKDRKVVITTNFYEITGVLGRGNAVGNLKVLKTQEERVSHVDIDGTFKGEVLVVGPILGKDTFKKAHVLGVAGLVTGGIHFRDLYNQEDNQMAVLVTEGLGKLAIGDDIWRLLKRFEGRTVFLRGEKNLLQIPLEEEVEEKCYPKMEEKKREIAVGNLVRLIGDPGPIGTVGKVLEIGKKKTKLESGIKTILVKVKIRDKEVEVPVNNLEIIQ